MRTISIVLPWRGGRDARRALALLDAANRMYGPVPSLLRSGVRYKRERRGREDWRTWPVIVAARMGSRVGDCEDLASWLAAYVGGRSHMYRSGPRLLHVVTRKGGIRLDPSAALGMKGVRRR